MIRQTHRVHEEIALVLHDLRKEKAEAGKAAEVKKQEGPERTETRFYAIVDREAVDDVVEAIPKFIAPETWNKQGGGTIHKMGRVIAVRLLHNTPFSRPARGACHAGQARRRNGLWSRSRIGKIAVNR